MTSGPDRQRELLGVHVTVQLVVFVLTALALTSLIAFAVLTWLERMA